MVLKRMRQMRITLRGLPEDAVQAGEQYKGYLQSAIQIGVCKEVSFNISLKLLRIELFALVAYEKIGRVG